MSVVKSKFFFFQAEDGIRDVAVTGVQTCALPISIGGGLLVSLHSPLAGRTSDAVAAEEKDFALNAFVRIGDRKSVVKGKSVDLGGRRIIKKKKKKKKKQDNVL